MKVLFVCTGNICRSAMAEYIAKDIINKQKLDISVFSRGIAVYMPEKSTQNSIAAVKRYGIDLTKHMSRQITKADIEKADIIFAMTLRHKEYILNCCPSASDKTFTLKEYVGSTDMNFDIADPYGQSLDVYNECAREIKENVEKAIEKVINRR